MYLQPSDTTLRPDNAKFRRRGSDKSLEKIQPLSGKLESTLDYMRDRGTWRNCGGGMLEITKVR